MFLPGGAFDGADDVPGNAKFGKGPKRGRTNLKVAHSFIKPNHTLLQQVIWFCALQEVWSSPHKD